MTPCPFCLDLQQLPGAQLRVAWPGPFLLPQELSLETSCDGLGED